MKLVFSRKKQEAGDAFSFFFRRPKQLTWQAGQFLAYTIEHPNPDQRGSRHHFTIASTPFEKQIMLTTRMNFQKSSSFKKALYNLSEGQTVEAEGPRGNFVVEHATEDHVFIAGGIGITPYRAILLDLDQRKLPINGKLFYANRTSEFIYQQELEDIAKRHRNFQIHYFVEPKRITKEAIQRLVPNLPKPLFYICGSQPMVAAMEDMLSGMGVPSNRVKQDYFPGYD